MTNIAFYISSHGFGHAARQQPVVRALAENGIRVHVRTAAPQFFFPTAASYNGQRYDIGMIQPDALTLDVGASLAWMADFIAQQPKTIADEVAFVRGNDVQLIISDMPPVAFDVAEEANLPGVAITHFTWDWVYAHYIDAYPAYAPMIDKLRKSYRKAGYVLQLPFAHPFDMFTPEAIEQVPMLINVPNRTRQQVRADLNITDSRPMVLLSMGGHAWGKSSIQALEKMTDCIFVVSSGAWEQVKDAPNFRKIPSHERDYHSILAHADLVVGKAGGSTVAEVIAHRRPFIYTTVPNWREAQLLHAALDTHGCAEYISPSEFERGKWLTAVPQMLNSASDHQWKPIRTDGVRVVVERMLSFLP